MAGRFSTVPFMLGALCLARLAPRLPPLWAPVACGALLLLSLPALAERRTERPDAHCKLPPSGIVDERECYVKFTGIAQNLHAEHWRKHPYLQRYRNALQGRRFDSHVVFDLIGMAPFGDDTDVHIVERYALSDPFLARLTLRPEGVFRPGHLPRTLPPGYLESLVHGDNRLADPCQRALLDDLRRVTRGELFSAERWRAIGRLNLEHPVCEHR